MEIAASAPARQGIAGQDNATLGAARSCSPEGRLSAAEGKWGQGQPDPDISCPLLCRISQTPPEAGTGTWSQSGSGKADPGRASATPKLRDFGSSLFLPGPRSSHVHSEEMPSLTTKGPPLLDTWSYPLPSAPLRPRCLR